MLPAGTYYIVVKASNGCKPGPFSDERKMTVTTGGFVLGAKTFRSAFPKVLGDSATPSVAPSVEPTMSPESTWTPTTLVAPTESGSGLNWFQRLINKIFGR
ncbi:MAG: hypothetical protein WCG44_04225 [bacterium]